MRFGLRLQCSGIFLEADDVFAHHPGDRRVQLGMNKALDLVSIVRRRHHARSRLGKIVQCMNAAHVAGLEHVIPRHKGRMRLVAHIRLDVNLVHAVGNTFRRCLGGQGAMALVQIA